MLVSNIRVVSNRTDRTRAVLQRCALELFLRDGYDATTVAAIAGAAGVSHMTFFRHFPTKESVVLDDPYDPIIAERVAAQPATLPALERVRRGFALAWADVPEPMDAEVRARIRLVAGHPGLRARMWENTQRTEQAVVDALLAGGVPRLQALVAAAACLGALTAALLDWAGDDAGQSLRERITAALDQLRPDGRA